MNEAKRTLDALLGGAAAGPQLFPPNSRYHGLATATRTAPDGRVLAYLRRRFVPQPERLATLKIHLVTQNDRLDLLAAQYFNDAIQFWRLCDANRALRPDELIDTIGRRLRITLPEGVPVAPRGR